MINILQMNDWEIKKFLKVVLTVQIAVLGIILLDLMGHKIPILREVIITLYLLFIPGILLLRIFRIHKLGNIETLLYSVGLSIFSIMFFGFLINMLPALGILKPISVNVLIVAISLFVGFLCILSYVIDKKFSHPDFINSKDISSPYFLFMCLIPFLAIFGTYLKNFHATNILLMILIILIAFMVIAVAFNKIPKKFYPFLVFIISISLLYHTSLISMQLWGWDIQHEFFLANKVIEYSYWDPSLPYNTNAMLSIVILAPIFSKLTGMDITWVFKLIYPLVFSLVPLGLYRFFQKQTDDKLAFLSVFFLMAIFTFYTEMNQLARQEIAELFLVMLFILMVSSNMKKTKRAILSVIFAISLIVSHYGLSYIYLMSLVMVYIILIFVKSSFFKKIVRKFRPNVDPDSNNWNQTILTSTYVFLFIVFALTWYMYLSSSSIIYKIFNIGNHIASSIFTDFLNPEAAQGAAAITFKTTSLLHEVAKYLNLLFQFSIFIGILALLMGRLKNYRFKKEYVVFAMVNFIILIISIVVPYFASALNITRLYHITLFLLAPFSVIGGIILIRFFLTKISNKSWTKDRDIQLKIIYMGVVVLFLFYSGFIYEVSGDNPTSFSLSNIDYPVFNDQEVQGLQWLSTNREHGYVYADGYRLSLLSRSFTVSESKDIPQNFSQLKTDSYIFLGNYNTKTGTILIRNKNTTTKNDFYMDYSSLANTKSQIYTNGNVTIYY
ncbi:MAG: DUF2206 domain-containing protein [Methanobacterium paludis]|nr:DUF2206 domain-containing protein [Methanobacterium paludis]